MGRIALVLVVVCLAGDLTAQALPRDITRSLDSFTGDTLLLTKYGRLDNPNGCGRSDIAIVWGLISGRGQRTERMTYQWYQVDAPFSGRADFLGAVAAFLNIDGDLVELDKHPLTPKFNANRGTREESGEFTLPAGTLSRIASSTETKLRIVGTNRTCDGTVERNMVIRIRGLTDAAQSP